MGELVRLNDIVLEPVVELEPLRFATRQRPTPELSAEEVPDEWDQYWLASLTDSGIAGLKPIRPGSWHVPTRRLTDIEILEKIIRGIAQQWGGPEELVGPGADPVLSGGLALVSNGRVLIEPMCCGDLRNFSVWKQAAEYRGEDWKTLWIGHPWISVRFNEASLVLSDLHEGGAPVSRYALSPDDLGKALGPADAELVSFSHRLQAAIATITGNQLAPKLARQLAGLIR